MLQKTHKISFHFFDIGGGDAIFIRFLGNDSKWHNLLIDGGYGKEYKNAFGALIKEIIASNEQIDCWIISHIDRDHIGAILGFLQDRSIKNKRNTVKKFLFNDTEETVQIPNGKIAVSDGITLREYLKTNNHQTDTSINTKSQPQDFHGLKITILSPTPEKEAIAAELWRVEEKKRSIKIGRDASQSDHKKTIQELKDLSFHSDTDPVNGSSIAILVEYEDITALLLADSHPIDVVDSISSLEYSSNNPIKVSFMQLSHHGSKANTNPELLQIVKTKDYVITGNGIHNSHPDKEALVRVLKQGKINGEAINIHFACDTKELRDMFTVDDNLLDYCAFDCTFSQLGPENKTLSYLLLSDQI